LKFNDIRLYDRNFNILAVLPGYLSVNWELKFSEFGLGEIQLEKTEEIVKILTENKYLFLVQGDIQSIVSGYKIGEICTVFTRTLEWLLTKFCVKKFKMSDLSAFDYPWRNKNDLIKYVLTEYLHEDFALQYNGIKDEVDMSEFVQSAPDNVYSVIKKIIDTPSVGFKFYRDFDEGRFVFQLLEGAKNENVVLCDNYRTSYESEYSVDIQNRATGGVFYHSVKNMGNWDPVTNTPLIIQEPSNYGQYYTATADGLIMGQYVKKDQFILCKRRDGIFEIVESVEPFLVEFPPDDDGIFSWSTPLSSTDTVSAQNELSQMKSMDMLTCNTRLSYGEDFKLGDIVKIKFFAGDFACEKEKLISEIHLWDEPEDSGAIPTTIDIS